MAAATVKFQFCSRLPIQEMEMDKTTEYLSS